MKKISFILFCLFICLIVNSQAKTHLLFKNIPIDGHINAFLEKMKGEGFTVEEKLDDIVIMSGMFINKKCTIYIVSTPKTQLTCRLGIYAPGSEDWTTLKLDYIGLRRLYTIKYGEPSKHHEHFLKPYYEGDGYEIQALSKEKCIYESYWFLKDGIIRLSIETGGKIMFTYEDAINTEIYSNENQSNALDEI